MVGEAGSQAPRAGEMRRRVGAREAGAAERPRQPGRDAVAQVRTGEAVVRALLAQRADELADRLLRDALAARQPELAREVEQHLVAARRRALEELVERLVVVELLGPHARLGGEHEAQRGAGVERPVAGRRRTTFLRWGAGRCRPCAGSCVHFGNGGCGGLVVDRHRRGRQREHRVAVGLDVQQLGRRAREVELRERRAHEPRQHRRARRAELDDPARAEAAGHRRVDERALRRHPLHRRRELAREQVDELCAGGDVGIALAVERERPPGDVRDPPPDEAAVIDGADEPFELGAQRGDGRRQQRRVKRDVDARQHPHRGRPDPRRKRGHRGVRSGHGVLAPERVVVDELEAVHAADRGLELGEAEPRERRIDDRHRVRRAAVGVAGDVLLHELTPREHELERGFELEHAERYERGELAGAVPGGERGVVAQRAGLAQLGELRGVQRHERRLRELGARQDAVGVAQDAAVGEPQLGRVALDDVQQRKAQARPGEGVGARPDRMRRARARAPVRAEAAALHALAAEGQHRPRRRDERLAGRRRHAVGEHRHLDHLEAVLQRHPGRLQLELRAERDRGDEAHPPAPEQGAVARAQRVDDEGRRARRGPGAVDDRPRQPGEAGGEHAAMQRVVVGADAREGVHAQRRGVLRLGQRHARPRVSRGSRVREARHRGSDRMRGVRAGGRAVPRHRRHHGTLAQQLPARAAAGGAHARHVGRAVDPHAHAIAGGERRPGTPRTRRQPLGIRRAGEHQLRVESLVAVARAIGDRRAAEQHEVGVHRRDHAARAVQHGAAGHPRRRPVGIVERHDARLHAPAVVRAAAATPARR